MVNNAWRCPPDDLCAREFAVTIECDGSPTDAVVAIFANGDRATYPSITIEDYLALEGVSESLPPQSHVEKKKNDKHVNHLWEGTDPYTSHALRVSWRKDRLPSEWLVSLYRKGKQICSVAPDRLEKCDDPEAMAAEVMVELATKYAAKAFGDNACDIDLYERRDTLIAGKGVALRPRVVLVMKWPAATNADESNPPLKRPASVTPPTKTEKAPDVEKASVDDRDRQPLLSMHLPASDLWMEFDD